MLQKDFLHTSERCFYNGIQLQVMICVINFSIILHRLLSSRKTNQSCLSYRAIRFAYIDAIMNISSAFSCI